MVNRFVLPSVNRGRVINLTYVNAVLSQIGGNVFLFFLVWFVHVVTEINVGLEFVNIHKRKTCVSLFVRVIQDPIFVFFAPFPSGIFVVLKVVKIAERSEFVQISLLFRSIVGEPVVSSDDEHVHR